MEKKGYRENLEKLEKAYPGRGMLTMNEVAAFCGVSRMTVVRWKDSGKLTVQQTGRGKKVLVPAQSLARFCAG